MHISEVEKYRADKEHQMRNGYADHRNARFPHQKEEIYPNEQIPQNNYGPGAP